MLDLRPLMESALSAFAVSATVTPPSGPSVEARVFWLPPTTLESPSGADVRVAEQRRVLVLPKSECGSVQRGTVITVPEYDGEEPTDWQVDSVDSTNHDHIRALVIPYLVTT
jgi:hypothetical protein